MTRRLGIMFIACLLAAVGIGLSMAGKHGGTVAWSAAAFVFVALALGSLIAALLIPRD